MKRIIGGAIFVIGLIVALFSNLYVLMYPMFVVIGIFELIRMHYKSSESHLIYLTFVGILFCLSMYILAFATHINSGFVLYITILIMLNDTFAFIIGRKFGKTKLSVISPKKTVEGSIGGLVFGMVSAIFIMEVFKHIDLQQVLFLNVSSIADYNIFSSGLELILISAVTIVIAQFSDLMESKLKRMYKTKDSGRILYGHGGILDRLDSWILSSIFICIYIILIGV